WIGDAVIDGSDLCERPRRGGADCCGQALDEHGHSWKLDVVAMVVGDRRQPEGVRHAAAVGLAFTCQREHRFQEAFESERGADLAVEPRDILSLVPKGVWSAGLDHDGLAGCCGDAPAAKTEADESLEDPECL